MIDSPAACLYISGGPTVKEDVDTYLEMTRGILTRGTKVSREENSGAKGGQNTVNMARAPLE
jgi:hypothetical protein